MIEAVAQPKRSLVREAVAYLLVIVAAEVVTMFFHPLWGVIGHAAIMATVQGNPGNDAVIWRAYRTDSTHIRIVFNKAPANPVSVAYWVVHTG